MTRGRSIIPIPAMRPVLAESTAVPALGFFPWLGDSAWYGPWAMECWETRWVDVLSYRPDRHGD